MPSSPRQTAIIVDSQAICSDTASGHGGAAVVECGTAVSTNADEQSGSDQLRFPGIDGLRALAVLGVIFFHLRVFGCFLGWSGVWLFFVISGFLITGILLNAKQRPNYFKNFYIRRALRIFPIYFFCLGALYFGVRLFSTGPVSGLSYYLFYFQNYHLAATRFEPAFPTAFNHTWSLAVEEQFYFLWPLAVRYASARVLKWICIGAIIIAPLSRGLLLYSTNNPYTAITPLVANVDALAAGALLALWMRTNRDQVQLFGLDKRFKTGCEVTFLMLSLLVLAIIFSHDPRDFWTPPKWLGHVNSNVALTTALSLLFTVLLFHVVTWNSWLRRLLELRWISHFGRISYGVYMFHGLVLTYATAWIARVNPELSHLRSVIFIVNLAATYLLALASWTYLEKPFLKLKSKFV